MGALLGASWILLGLHLKLLDASWVQLGDVGRLLGSTLEPLGRNLEPLGCLFVQVHPIWAPRRPSELKLALCTANMSSNLPSSCTSRALQTFKKCGRVVKIRGSGFLAVHAFLDGDLEPLRRQLGRLWAPFGVNLALLGDSWAPWVLLGFF